MFKERVKAIGAAVAGLGRNAFVTIWAGVGFVGAGLAALFQPILRVGKRFLLWLAVPKGDTPVDVLKHFVSVIVVLIGGLSLVWAGVQIAYPPLVITVAKLPDALEREAWLNPELSRTLIGQIETLRATVKGERDPSFKAVLNPPNITIKSADGWSLNVQEQILTPIGSLLGRGQGEVHLALNCYHPGCARTTDKECRELAPKEPEAKLADRTGDVKPAPRQYLCLRMAVDIQRGLSHRRLTTRLVVSPDDAEMTDAMARVAEAVTTVADPATATLYFYRRIREEKRNPNVAPDVIADLVSEASKAAEQAEANDAVSACWAHTIRAHLAVDRREFNLAQIYLARAKNLSVWSHLAERSKPSDCRRLIVIAEMEFARQLVRPQEIETYPPHHENNDKLRKSAAFKRASDLLAAENDITWWGRLLVNSDANDDLKEALKLVQAEIGLSWLSLPHQCALLATRRTGVARAPQEEQPTVDITAARSAVTSAIAKLDSLEADVQLPSLTRQAALDFMSLFARNADCIEDVVAILQKIELNHPTDQRVTQLLIAITEAAGLRKTASLERPIGTQDKGNNMLDAALKIYQRIAATGADRTGHALLRLAIFAEAKSAENGDDKILSHAPSEETLQNLKRAWQRHERDINATRERGELIVAFWGMVLMGSYPTEVVAADFSRLEQEIAVNAEYRNASASKMDFDQALRTLYPAARAARLADLPQLKDIGPRIGCLCMLYYVTTHSELQDFFIGRLDRWQRRKIDYLGCRDELIPQIQTKVPERIAKAADLRKTDFEAAEAALKANAEAPKLKEAYEQAKKGHEEAQRELTKATADAERYSRRFKRKLEIVKTAAQVCYVDKAPEASQTAPSSDRSP